MKVYIEYAIIDNLALNSVVCLLTGYLLRSRLKWHRVAITAVFGTIFALLLPLLKINIAVLSFFLKIICSFFMVFFLKKYNSKKQFFIFYIVFLLLTFLLGGAAFGLIFLLEQNFEAAINLQYQKGLPIGIFIAAIFVVVALTIRFVAFYQRFKNIKAFCYEAQIFYDGKQAKLTAFLDSGNALYDPLTNLPVMVVGISVLYRLLGEEIVQNIVCGKNALKTRTINCQTISGSSKLLIFKPQKLEIYSDNNVNILYDVMIGISYKNFDSAAGFEGLLHPALMQ